jgi:hypothetical protein
MRMRAAPVARTSASLCAERPAESSTIFAITAFSDQRTTADHTKT